MRFFSIILLSVVILTAEKLSADSSDNFPSDTSIMVKHLVSIDMTQYNYPYVPGETLNPDSSISDSHHGGHAYGAIFETSLSDQHLISTDFLSTDRNGQYLLAGSSVIVKIPNFQRYRNGSLKIGVVIGYEMVDHTIGYGANCLFNFRSSEFTGWSIDLRHRSNDHFNWNSARLHLQYFSGLGLGCIYQTDLGPITYLQLGNNDLAGLWLGYGWSNTSDITLAVGLRITSGLFENHESQ